VAVPVAQCVSEKRACDLCVPAAEFLVGQVTAGRPKSDIAEIYASRFDPKKVKTIVEGDSAWKGAKEPLVTVIEFADFECPACGAANPLIEMMYDKYGKQMRLVFKHFPLAAHPNAKLAAQAAYAAHQQGLFWKMHKLMFDNQLRLTEPDLVQYATEAGLEVSRFKKDMHSEAAKEAVNQDKSQGESLGVSATPTIYINGRDCDLSKLANPVKDLESWIELDIAEAKKKGRQPAGDGN
jgi:protein-disulfide isomerase